MKKKRNILFSMPFFVLLFLGIAIVFGMVPLAFIAPPDQIYHSVGFSKNIDYTITDRCYGLPNKNTAIGIIGASDYYKTDDSLYNRDTSYVEYAVVRVDNSINSMHIGVKGRSVPDLGLISQCSILSEPCVSTATTQLFAMGNADAFRVDGICEWRYHLVFNEANLCGNNICDSSETPSTCSLDCHILPGTFTLKILNWNNIPSGTDVLATVTKSGESPIVLNIVNGINIKDLQPGTYELKIKVGGYEDYIKIITIESSKFTQEEITLIQSNCYSTCGTWSVCENNVKTRSCSDTCGKNWIDSVECSIQQYHTCPDGNIIPIEQQCQNQNQGIFHNELLGYIMILIGLIGIIIIIILGV